jgi:staphyloferrin B biosynthesis citrate synthase
MRTAGFKARMAAGDRLVGTFVKTPEVNVIEVMALAGLDFICLDAEHCAFDRGRMDACLAIARALDLPTLVRVGAATPQDILQALDSGAVGVVVPHVDSVAKAEMVAKAAHFGRGGRGFAGSTRWAGFAGRTMAEVMAQDSETVVIAQIEEPEGVDVVEQIAAVEGIDALFAGPADLSVGFGKTSVGSPELDAAMTRIGAAARAVDKVYVSWMADAGTATDWIRYGISVFVVGSDHALMLAQARDVAKAVRKIPG